VESVHHVRPSLKAKVIVVSGARSVPAKDLHTIHAKTVVRAALEDKTLLEE
jgi:hypothetical protein